MKKPLNEMEIYKYKKPPRKNSNSNYQTFNAEQFTDVLRNTQKIPSAVPYRHFDKENNLTHTRSTKHINFNLQ